MKVKTRKADLEFAKYHNIPLSDRNVYRNIKALKDKLGLSWNELIKKLITRYTISNVVDNLPLLSVKTKIVKLKSDAKPRELLHITKTLRSMYHVDTIITTLRQPCYRVKASLEQHVLITDACYDSHDRLLIYTSILIGPPVNKVVAIQDALARETAKKILELCNRVSYCKGVDLAPHLLRHSNLFEYLAVEATTSTNTANS